MALQAPTALSTPLCSASVLIGGKEVPVYQINKKDGVIEGYIEAKTGVEYCVQGSKLAAASEINSIGVSADGEWVGGSLDREQGTSGWTDVIEGPRSGKTGYQSLIFEEVQIAGPFETANAVPEELGVIRVEFIQATNIKRRTDYVFGEPRVTGSHRKFPDSTLECCSHETVYGSVKTGASRTPSESEDEVVQTFRFKYISKELLERKLSIEEIEKLRHNTRFLEIERQHLKHKLVKMEIEALRQRISVFESQSLSGSTLVEVGSGSLCEGSDGSGSGRTSSLF